MTNILVPTDFTPASLKIAEAAVRSTEGLTCNLILFHAFSLPSSPFDLLGASHLEPYHGLLTEGFRQACKHLKDEYGKTIGRITVKVMRGDTRALFRNFLDANDIDLVFCPEEFSFTSPHAMSIDPRPFFKKCGVPVVRSQVRKKEQAVQAATFPAMQFSTQ